MTLKKQYKAITSSEKTNNFGGGVAIYIQNHIPVKQREDLMMKDIEALWVQVHLPHLKPIVIGCCYRPPNANSLYLY